MQKETQSTHCNTEREKTAPYRTPPFVALPGFQIVETSRNQGQTKIVVIVNGAETNCGIARILGILLMNRCDT